MNIAAFNRKLGGWLLVGFLALFSSMTMGLMIGCNGENKWDHPNRERYPAPPPEEHPTTSLEELERIWAEQDAQEQRAAGVEQQEDAPRGGVDLAAHQIRQALEAAMETLDGGEAPPGAQPPVGGGPPQ